METTVITMKEISMSNLSHQFDGMQKAYEDKQRRRYARKQGVSGYIGNGYGYMTGTLMSSSLMAGMPIETHSEQYENPVQELGENLGQTANAGTGMGEGGTAAAATGAAGGSPA